MAGLLGLVVLAGACARVDVPPSLPDPTTTTIEPTPTGSPEDCPNPLASLRPDGPATSDVPPGSTMEDIQLRERVRVGVDVGSLNLSSVDPLTGDVEGFDVDIAREVALALFGGPRDDIDDHIELVGLPSSDRVPALVDGRVDLVASALTITCERREQVELSTEYLRAGQRVLVRVDDPARSIEDLGDRQVCVTAGSSAIDNITVLDLDPPPVIAPAPQRIDCLVRLQQGLADAVVTDDAILAGMAAQDPGNLRIVGDPISEEPYGLGLPPGQEDWVRYVNAVLEDVRDSGRWDDLYDEWLADLLQRPADPPPPVYRDEAS